MKGIPYEILVDVHSAMVSMGSFQNPLDDSLLGMTFGEWQIEVARRAVQAYINSLPVAPGDVREAIGKLGDINTWLEFETAEIGGHDINTDGHHDDVCVQCHYNAAAMDLDEISGVLHAWLDSKPEQLVIPKDIREAICDVYAYAVEDESFMAAANTLKEWLDSLPRGGKA